MKMYTSLPNLNRDAGMMRNKHETDVSEWIG